MRKPLNLSARLLIIWMSIILSLVIGCESPNDNKGRVLVFAATSLTDVLDELEETFEAREHIDVTISYGASQTLAQQIASGAPANVFFSAGSFPMHFLDDRGLIEPPIYDVMTNKLVMVTSPKSNISMGSLRELDESSVMRIAIGDPDVSPAGKYTQQSLTRFGLWQKLESKLILGSDVRTAMAYLESGNVDVAFVYSTDAMANPYLSVLDIVPSTSHSPIVYPLASVKRTDSNMEVAILLEFLNGDEAGKVFRKHGFVPAK